MKLFIWMLMLSAITLNVNGLHDPKKWAEFWQFVPCVDILYLQEIHLVCDQLFAFQLYAQGYDWFFSLGTSNSAGVCIGVRHTLGVMACKVTEVKGHMLAIDLAGNVDL